MLFPMTRDFSNGRDHVSYKEYPMPPVNATIFLLCLIIRQSSLENAGFRAGHSVYSRNEPALPEERTL